MKEKTIKLGKAKLRFSDSGHNKIAHLNLGRYKRNKETDTVTIYESIADKEYGNLIGVEICWAEDGYAHVWLDFQK